MSDRERHEAHLHEALADVSSRALHGMAPLAGSERDLFRKLKLRLIAGFNDDRLLTPIARVHKLLTLEESRDDSGIWAINGGKKDQARRSHDQVFERFDHARFHFSITVASRGKSTELLAYAFEIYYSQTRHADRAPRFVRFDLNHPGHRNEERSMRSHVHPGHDDLQAPSPWFHPAELLALFLYGLELPDKARMKG